jgi:hypothetical protein
MAMYSFLPLLCLLLGIISSVPTVALTLPVQFQTHQHGTIVPRIDAGRDVYLIIDRNMTRSFQLPSGEIAYSSHSILHFAPFNDQGALRVQMVYMIDDTDIPEGGESEKIHFIHVTESSPQSTYNEIGREGPGGLRRTITKVQGQTHLLNSQIADRATGKGLALTTWLQSPPGPYYQTGVEDAAVGQEPSRITNECNTFALGILRAIFGASLDLGSEATHLLNVAIDYSTYAARPYRERVINMYYLARPPRSSAPDRTRRPAIEQPEPEKDEYDAYFSVINDAGDTVRLDEE